ncbi:mariner Mos1 transposase [Trichonephila clavipes]|nr:mariner Mos1 transposase [Trichonephila clavipes]
MSAYKPNSHHLRKVLIFCIGMKKSAAETHRMLSNTYGETGISERMCREWFNASRTVVLTSKASMAFGGTSSA